MPLFYFIKSLSLPLKATISISISAIPILKSVVARVHVCIYICVSELIYLLQSPPSLVQQGLIYAVAVVILWRMLKWHHSSALTPVCSLTLPLPADSSTPGMIYQALKQQTKAPRNVCRARDGLIDKHCDSRTKHRRGSTS